MTGTTKRLLLSSIVIGSLGFVACSDDDNGGGGGTGGATTGGATIGTGGARAGGATYATGGTTARGGATSTAGSTSTAGAGGGTTAAGGASGGDSGTGGASGGETAVAGGGAGGEIAVAGGGAGGEIAVAGGGSGGETSTTTVATDDALYNFETGTQSWSSSTYAVATSTTQVFAGTQSLAITVPALAVSTGATVNVSGGLLWPGAVVTLHVWTPTGTDGLYVQAYSVLNNWAIWDTSGNAGNGTLTRGGWTTWTYTVPNGFPGGMVRWGVQIGTGSTGTFAGGDIYIDSISVVDGTADCTQGDTTGTNAFSFDTTDDVSGWAFDTANSTLSDVTIAQSSTGEINTGAGSLAVTMTAIPAATDATTPTTRRVYFDKPVIYCGQPVTLNVWLPSEGDANLTVKAFVDYNNWGVDATEAPTTITYGGWTNFTATIPSNVSAGGIQRIGLEFDWADTANTFTGVAYIDDVSW